MLRQTTQELRALLEFDPDVRILIVEGARDLGFWRCLAAEQLRAKLTLRPVDTVVAEGCSNRERVIAVARELGDSGRVLGFVDADWSRIIGETERPHVVMTDYRDCEGYFIAHGCLERVCARALVKGEGHGQAVEDTVVEACRALGVLRVASERNSLKLPIGGLLEEKKAYQRLWDEDLQCLDAEKLLRQLLEKRDSHLRELDRTRVLFQEETTRLSRHDARALAHGKDFVGLAASLLGQERGVLTGLLNLAVEPDAIRSEAAVRWVLEWAGA